MIVKLDYTNRLPIPVLLLNNQGTGQPLAPGQALEMVFEMQVDEDGVATLLLICEPGS